MKKKILIVISSICLTICLCVSPPFSTFKHLNTLNLGVQKLHADDSNVSKSTIGALILMYLTTWGFNVANTSADFLSTLCDTWDTWINSVRGYGLDSNGLYLDSRNNYNSDTKSLVFKKDVSQQILEFGNYYVNNVIGSNNSLNKTYKVVVNGGSLYSCVNLSSYDSLSNSYHLNNTTALSSLDKVDTIDSYPIYKPILSNSYTWRSIYSNSGSNVDVYYFSYFSKWSDLNSVKGFFLSTSPNVSISYYDSSLSTETLSKYYDFNGVRYYYLGLGYWGGNSYIEPCSTLIFGNTSHYFSDDLSFLKFILNNNLLTSYSIDYSATYTNTKDITKVNTNAISTTWDMNDLVGALNPDSSVTLDDLIGAYEKDVTSSDVVSTSDDVIVNVVYDTDVDSVDGIDGITASEGVIADSITDVFEGVYSFNWDDYTPAINKGNPISTIDSNCFNLSSCAINGLKQVSTSMTSIVDVSSSFKAILLFMLVLGVIFTLL